MVDFEACAVYNYCHGGPIIISTDNLSIPGFFPSLNSDESIDWVVGHILYLSHYDNMLGKRLMFRMHFIMSQLVQRSKHKGSNFATLQHKFQTDADVFQGWHCQDVGC